MIEAVCVVCVCVCVCGSVHMHACMRIEKDKIVKGRAYQKCGLRMPGSLSEGLQGQNYFHNNTEMLFALSTVWTDLH